MQYMYDLEFSLDAAFKYVHKIETIYSTLCAIKSVTEELDVGERYQVWNNSFFNKEHSATVFYILAFNPSNCYPEKHERYPNDDMWFEYKEDADMSSIEVPDDFNAQDLTEEWWFQQNLVHDDIDLFFYIAFKMLYHNNIVKESVSFSCLYIDDLYNEIQINMPRTPVS
ncbi:TPA: hypothetical protein RVU01_003439 [Escherichia coli]|nr:hypothetical protein [Escherichia coli]